MKFQVLTLAYFKVVFVCELLGSIILSVWLCSISLLMLVHHIMELPWHP